MNKKFHENPSSWRRIVPCSQTQMLSYHSFSQSRPREGRKCNFTHSLTSVLDGVDGQCHAPAALTPGKGTGTHFTGGWVAAGASLDGCGKSLFLSVFDPRTFQAVASSYTD